MVLLYISNITGKKSAGTDVVIPQIIREQSKYNYTIWINLNNAFVYCWSDCANEFYNLSAIKSFDFNL